VRSPGDPGDPGDRIKGARYIGAPAPPLLPLKVAHKFRGTDDTPDSPAVYYATTIIFLERHAETINKAYYHLLCCVHAHRVYPNRSCPLLSLWRGPRFFTISFSADTFPIRSVLFICLRAFLLDFLLSAYEA
jgi:hypothetical protein